MQEVGFPMSSLADPCTHSFCKLCTESLSETAKIKGVALSCPICRRHLHGFVLNPIATKMLLELDKCKDQLRDMKDKERDTHKRERKLAQDNNATSLRVAHLEGELAKALSDRQCEVDRNEHLKKMCKLIEMEKETLSERLQDLQKKLQAELEESSRRISIMENEVSEYQNQLRISTEETAKAESDNADLRARIQETEERIMHAQEEKRVLEARISDLNEQLFMSLAETKRMQVEHDSMLDDIRSRSAQEVHRAQTDYESLQDELRAKAQAYALQEKRSRELEMRATLLEVEIRRAKEELIRADRRASELDVTVKKTEVEKAGTGQILSQMESMLGTYKDEVKMLEREKYDSTRKAAELEGTLARMKSDALKLEEERSSMKERVWKAERDLAVMKQERDRMRETTKKKEERQNETYLGGFMKNLKPISNAIWGDQPVYGPLVKNINDFFLLERRGGKKDGRVWKCKSKLNGNFFVLKSLPSSVPQNAQGSTDLTVFREALLLKTMDHPNIICVEGITRDSKGGSLNMVLSPFIDIDLDYSIGQKTMNALEIRTLLYQLLLAVDYMHKNDLVHRNIKPTNILRYEDYTLKLGGFSYACSTRNLSIDMVTPRPPTWFTAPEVFLAQTNSKAQRAIDWKAVDIWAVGCVLAEMLLQKPLFAGPSDPVSNIRAVLDIKPAESSAKLYPDPGNSLATLLARSPYAQHPSFRPAFSLLYSLLSLEPSSRITASQALQHEYIGDLNRKETIRRDISREVQDSCLPQFIETDCEGIV
jgi:hypothetical protein